MPASNVWSTAPEIVQPEMSTAVVGVVDDRDVFLVLIAAGRVVVDRAEGDVRIGDLGGGHACQAVEIRLALGEEVGLHAGDGLRRCFERAGRPERPIDCGR